MLSVIAPVSSLPTQPVKRVVDVIGQSGVSARQDTATQPSSKTTSSAAPKAKLKSVEQEWQIAQVIQQLKQRDQQVRAHEQAHLSAAGPYANSAAHYVYQTGPDGRKYAIGGEVGIDLSPERDPEATIRKMQNVQRAALAPADPSPQDMRVPAMAALQMMRAQQALQIHQGEKRVSGEAESVKATGASDALAEHGGEELRRTNENAPLAERQAWEVRNRLTSLRGETISKIR